MCRPNLHDFQHIVIKCCITAKQHFSISKANTVWRAQTGPCKGIRPTCLGKSNEYHLHWILVLFCCCFLPNLLLSVWWCKGVLCLFLTVLLLHYLMNVYKVSRRGGHVGLLAKTFCIMSHTLLRFCQLADHLGRNTVLFNTVWLIFFTCTVQSRSCVSKCLLDAFV